MAASRASGTSEASVRTSPVRAGPRRPRLVDSATPQSQALVQFPTESLGGALGSYADLLVHLTIRADGIGRCKDQEEMGIKLFGHDGGESAEAREVPAFLMGPAVVAYHADRREDLLKMVANLLVFEFREAAKALDRNHVKTFL